MKQTILITGTSRGIGEYVAEKLVDEYQVLGVARSAGKYVDYTVDLSVPEQVERFCEQLGEQNITLDTLVCNAGVGYFGDFQQVNMTEYNQIIQTNLLGVIHLIYGLKGVLSPQAKIICIGSIAAKKFMKHAAVYQASKFGLRGFAGALKNETTYKIHLVNPKIVDTTFHDSATIPIEVPEKHKTDIHTIYKVIEKIISGEENRFEIDV